MPRVGCPRWILVHAFARELLHRAIAERDHHDLKHAANLRLEGDVLRIGRPIRIRSIILISKVKWSQELNVGAVDIHNVYLGMPGAARCEGDAPAVGAELGRRVVRAMTHRDPPRPTTREVDEHQIGARFIAMRVGERESVRRESRSRVQASGGGRERARRAARDVLCEDAPPAASEHAVRDRVSVGRPCGGEREPRIADQPLAESIAVDYVHPAAAHEENARLRNAARARDPLLDLVRDAVHGEAPLRRTARRWKREVSYLHNLTPVSYTHLRAHETG